MRLGPRAFPPSTLLLSFVAIVLGSTAAHASSTTLSAQFTGSVTGLAPGVPSYPGTVTTGDAITGSFAYDPSQVGSSASGVYTFTTPTGNIHQALTFAISVANFGDGYLNSSYTVTIKDTGTKGATLDIHAVTAAQKTVDNKVEYAYIDLTFTSTTYTGTLLPTTTTGLSSFNLSNGSLIWDPGGNSGLQGTVGVTGGSLFGPASVPEPSSLTLAFIAVAMGSVGYFTARRKANARP